VGVHLVGLANGTAGDKALDERIKARPPEVLCHKVLGVEDAAVAPGSRLVEGGNKVVVGALGDIESPLEVQLFIVVQPVLSVGTGKKGGPFIEGLEGREHEGVRGGGQGDFVSKGDIDGAGEEVIREEHELQVVIGYVDVVAAGEGIGGTHLDARSVVEVQVVVLQKQVTACLAMRQLVRLAEICEVLVVCQDCDNVGGSQEVVLPFFQGMDDSE
jgi:hypothetical protein